MKKCLVLVLACLLLSGCGAEETFETISDELIQPVSTEAREIVITLPPEAVTPVSESEDGALYMCDGYEIALQTLAAGDLDATVRSISGYSRDDLTVMETSVGDLKKYELVWASAGELGDRIGKATILDDGSYHYAVSVMADADVAHAYEGIWQTMFDSFALG